MSDYKREIEDYLRQEIRSWKSAGDSAADYEFYGSMIGPFFSEIIGSEISPECAQAFLRGLRRGASSN